MVSGALRIAAGHEFLGIGRRAITGGAVLLGVFLLDLLFLAVLIGWRAEEPQVPANGRGARLPEYDETEVRNFHGARTAMSRLALTGTARIRAPRGVRKRRAVSAMVILPIGSGKGGVGKSLLATNLSIALAEAGRKVVLVDLDLGASNAHTMLGIRSVSRGIGTFLSVSAHELRGDRPADRVRGPLLRAR